MLGALVVVLGAGGAVASEFILSLALTPRVMTKTIELRCKLFLT